MKRFVVIMLFTKDYKKLLWVKRNKEPFKNCWNGIGGKIEKNETVEKTAIRECKEETGLKLTNPKLLITYQYPESQSVNSNIELNVLYDFIEEPIRANEEGRYEWKDIEFAMHFNNKEIAGFSNIGQFIKEIYDLENIKKFYH